MAEIGVVIVTYNSEEEIGACLDALQGEDVEIVVVDNASADRTCEEALRRGARLIRNTCNAGFAAAANQGFRALSTPFILLLNPDARLACGLAAMRTACSLPRAAMSCGKLLGEDGKPQIGFMIRRLPTPASLALEVLLLNRVLPKNRVNRRFRCLDLDYAKEQAVEQPAGAFVMICRAAWEDIGGFDESFYPLWFEDVDFCKRMNDRGYYAYYTPEAVAKHTGGHSIPTVAVEMRAYYWYRSLLRYAARHFRPLAVRALSAAVIVGSILRIVAASVLRRSQKPMAMYGKVVRLAGRVLMFGWRERTAPVSRL